MELPKERLRNRHEPTHHRGRAALQRRVQPSKKEPGFSPCGWLVGRTAACRSHHEPGVPRTHPLRVWKRHDREGRALNRASSPRKTQSNPPRLLGHDVKATTSNPRSTVEERRFSAASSAITRKTGFSPCGRLSLGHRKLARNGTTSVVPQSHKNPVIPNRAESPVRILLLADAISEGWVRGIPRLAPGRPGKPACS